MSVIKTISRKIVFPLVTGLGIEKIVGSFSDNSRLILCYHGCSHSPDFSINGRHIASKQLDQHFAYLKKNFTIHSLDEMFASYRTNKKPNKKMVAITFDDGYLNNYTTAFPLIKKHNIPAAFFILSKPLMDDKFINWPDILDLIKRYGGLDSIKIGSHDFKKINGRGYFSESLNTSAGDFIKNNGRDRDIWLEKLMNEINFDKLLNNVNKDYYKFLNVEQLKEMACCDLVEIGSHCHSHYNLANISADLAAYELMESKRILEEVIGKNVNTVAYPDGSYNANVKNIAEKAGYRNQVAVSYQCPDDEGDKRILPRLTISNTTTFESSMIFLNLGFRSRGF